MSFFLFPLTGLFALSINHSNSYLAYPGSATNGEIIVYDANSLVRLTHIREQQFYWPMLCSGQWGPSKFECSPEQTDYISPENW